MWVATLNENPYFVASPALLVPDESRETIAELSSPISLAIPIIPNILFSSIIDSPTFVLIIKVPVPPDSTGLSTLSIVNL